MIAGLAAALAGCGGSPDPEVVYDGSYVPCKPGASGTSVSPQPDHPDCHRKP